MRGVITSAGKLALLAAVMALLPGAQSRLGDLDSRILDSHNRERALAGVPALRWNDELAEGAQAWADHLSMTGKFEHSPNLPGRRLEGENIWGGTSGAFRPESMVGLWIAEKADFIPGVFPANSRTGRPEDVAHYTQVIWGQSIEVGCGLSQQGREEILVCRYSAPGNVKGRDPFASPVQFPQARPQNQLALRSPLALSAAGLVDSASALMAGPGRAGSPGSASPPANGFPPAASANIRDEAAGRSAVGTAAPLASKSAILAICGWSPGTCSWLTD